VTGGGHGGAHGGALLCFVEGGAISRAAWELLLKRRRHHATIR